MLLPPGGDVSYPLHLIQLGELGGSHLVEDAPVVVRRHQRGAVGVDAVEGPDLDERFHLGLAAGAWVHPAHEVGEAAERASMQNVGDRSGADAANGVQAVPDGVAPQGELAA